jgi:hydroxymethylpyrimidine kinase/phosphomethylpyrimidine kinase
VTLWIVGGLDPTGGAGILRDRATARTVAPDLPVSVVVTAETEQGDGKPARARARSVSAIERELAGLPAPVAVKIGLVPDEVVDAVRQAVRARARPIVLDPVLRASDGGALGSSAAGQRWLASVCTLVTPNRDEAEALAGGWTGGDDAMIAELARVLAPAAVLLKRSDGVDPDRVCDVLVVGGATTRFERARRPGPDPRGTGCALATAIACGLARGESIADACGSAIAWLDDARTRTVPGPDGRPHLS